MNSKFLLLFVIASVILVSYSVNDTSVDSSDGYAVVELDKKIYTWTDKIYITIIAHITILIAM